AELHRPTGIGTRLASSRMRGTKTLLLVGALVVGTALPAAGQLPPGGSFVDDDGSVHEEDIEAIRAADITRGCNPPRNDRFGPSRRPAYDRAIIGSRASRGV